MKVFICPQCLFALDVVGLPGELELVTEGLDGGQCPRCGTSTTGVHLVWEVELDEAAKGLRRLSLSPLEAFVAFQGAGLPAERQLPELDELVQLLNRGVARVAAKRVGDYVVVDFIELSDKSRIFFGASGDGAIIYRIANPPAYTGLVTRSSK